MKKTITIAVFFIFLKTISQNNEGKIIYKFSTSNGLIDSETINQKDSKYNGMLGFINKSLKNNTFLFILKFNESESIFYKQETLENESDKSYKIANTLLKADDVIYTNYKTNIKKTSKTVYGEDYIVVNKYNAQEWKLTNQRKLIGDYECFKAVSSVTVKNNKGTFEKEIFAWYAPSIPVNFGPKGYGGLPGLILELFEGNFRYFASEIVLSQKDKFKIHFSEKGKLITQKELDQIGQKLYKQKRAVFTN